VVDVKERSGRAASAEARQDSIAEKLKSLTFKKKVTSRDFMVFCRQFATMIKAGMNVLRCLQVLSHQVDHPDFQERLQAIAINVEKGKTLTESLREYRDFFPSLLINMVEAGEAGGVLDTVLERLAEHFEKQHDLEQKLRSATLYPIVVSAVALIVLSVLVLFVLPQFSQIFVQMGVDMPWITRAILGLSDFVISFWYLVVALIIIVVVTLRRYIKTEKGRENLDSFRLKAPIYGPIYCKTIYARFARTLSTLLASGVNLLTALELVERVLDNVVVGATLEKTRDEVERGQVLAQPLAASGHFPPLLIAMTEVGEESGDLDGMLSRAADFFENEVSYVVDRLSTIIEPVLIVLIGGIVGLIVASIILPMFEIYQMI